MPGFFLSNGEVVLIAFSMHRLDQGAQQWLDAQVSRVSEINVAADSSLKGKRVALFGTQPGGTRAVWDLVWT
jgi:hypothetical protein